MRHFYENVDVDIESMKFSAACAICGNKQLANRLPMLFRDARRLERSRNGRADKLSQTVFNHLKASSVQLLAIHFNRCENCHRFVCDNCYDISVGLCKECKNK